MIDLHTHSRFSDGSDSPEELVCRARRLGLQALALTDHDNILGVPAFLDACRARHLTGLSGVELSAEVPSGTLHLIGLGIDPACGELGEALGRLRDGREWRNRRILERLRELGCALEWDAVAAYAGEEVIGRPHIALAMIARGWVATVQEAFDRFLGKGAPAYVDRYRLTPAEALRLIRRARGLAILAHPGTWLADSRQLEAGVAELKAGGLAGIEAYYTTHDAGQTIDYLRLAQRQGLLVSGGSDYHGRQTRPDTELGSGTGRLQVPDTLLAPLFDALGPEGHYHRETQP
jgi:predicted metal-dependent phosphoesterase TrpH